MLAFFWRLLSVHAMLPPPPRLESGWKPPAWRTCSLAGCGRLDGTNEQEAEQHLESTESQKGDEK